MAKWRNVVGWTAVGTGILVLLLVLTAILLLKNSGFQHYLISKIEQQANEATGARIKLQGLVIHIKTLTADIYGLSVHGNEGTGEKPLVEVPHARIGLKFLSVVHRKVNLSELLIENPAVNLLVNKDGRSNLPEPPPKKGQSNTNVFDLAVGHVLLMNGEIRLRDQKTPLNANIFDLRTEITFHQLAKKYTGTVSYSSGQIQYAHLRPLSQVLEAKFDATPSEFHLNPLLLKIGASQARIIAHVQNYSETPVVSGSYDVLLHTQDFDGIAPAASTSGDIAFSGKVDFRDIAGQPLLKNVSSSGELRSDGLVVESSQAAVKIKKLVGHYQLASGTLIAQGFAFDLLNGRLTADGIIEHLDSTPRSRARVALNGISLQALKSALRGYSDRTFPITGRLDASANSSWTGSLRNIRATAKLAIRGNVIGSDQARRQIFPLKVDLRAGYDAPRGIITVPASQIQLPATLISAQGEVGGRSKLMVHAASTNLHQLMLMVAIVPPLANPNSKAKPPVDIQGAATLNASVEGKLQTPRISAHLVGTNLGVNQTEWKSLESGIVASPSEIALQNGSLVSAKRGRLTFSGQAKLRHWSYSSEDPISAALHIEQLPATELQSAANLKYPIEGDVFADLRLTGSQLMPQGQGQLRLVKARAYAEPLQSASAQFRAANGTVQSTLDLAIAAGALKASLNYVPKTKAYEVKLDAPRVALNKLHAVQAKNLPIDGNVSASVGGKGTLEDPVLSATVEVPQLRLRDTTASQIKASLDVGNHMARISLSSGVGQATLRGNGTMKLSPGYYTEASLDTSKFPLDPLFGIYMPSRPAGLHGESELHLSVRGPIADKSKMEAHLTVPTLHARYQALEIANAAPIRIDYENSLVTLQSVGFKGTGTSLQIQGRIPVRGEGKINVSAKGSVDMRLVQMFNPDIRSQGSVVIDVNANGTAKNPAPAGQIRVENVSLDTPALPVGLENFNARMQLTSAGIQITNAAGQVGGGQVTIGGSVLYKPQLQMNVALSARSVRLRYPEGMRTIFSSDLALNGNRQGALLQGRVLVDSLSFTSDFDATTFMGQFSGTAAPADQSSFMQNVKLQIAVQSSSQLNAATSQVSIEGQADLRVIGSAADPVITGRANLSSGDIFFNKRQYHLERGIITFVNPNETEPVFNVLITTTIEQYSLSVSVVGPINKLQTNYVSDPPLPPADVINLIARGQTTQEGAPTSFGANTILAAGLGQVGSNVSKLTGISGLQIDPLIGGNNTNPSARLGIQKRVTKSFIFTFSTDVTQPQNEIVQGEYQLNKRWSVSVVRNESGGFAVDGRFHTNF